MTTKNDILLKIPCKLLSNDELSLNDKLILGMDYTFSLKFGNNSMNNKQISELFHLHINIVRECRKKLLNKGYITKDSHTFFFTSKIEESVTSMEDKRTIYIPFCIYNHPKLRTGEKLLWGEYNSFSKGEKAYFASRDYTAKRLNVSKESITNWTKFLEQENLISLRYNIGYCTNQKIVTTCKIELKC